MKIKDHCNVRAECILALRVQGRAEPGDIGIVVNLWVNSYGTEKAGILKKDGEIVMTTSKCLEVLEVELSKEWREVKSTWLMNSSVPVIGILKAVSKKGAGLIKPMRGVETWVNNDMSTDVKKENIGRAITVYVPIWLARKHGILPTRGEKAS